MKIDLLHGDCLELMKDIADGSIDMILTDPPYGTTACKWDSVIPFEPMWEHLKRIIKPDGAIVLFGSEPFSSALRMSNIKQYRYEWYWEKTNVTGFANAKKQPLRNIECISVFYSKTVKYNPQGIVRVNKLQRNGKTVGGAIIRGDKDFGNGKGAMRTQGHEYIQEFTNYPKHILRFKRDSGNIHPTQKPVALLEYLVKTYTQEGETVLDFTMGSGSTGVACINTSRNFIGIELDDNYFQIASNRINEAPKEKE